MPEINAPYAPGTPCWIDLMAADQAAAMGFYGDLFGWEGEVGPEEFGGYALMTKNGRSVAGIGPKMGPDMPHVWTTYLATDDAYQTAEAVTAAGGAILAPPMDVGTLGTMCVAADPAGAVFGFWGHKDFYGATLVNEDGALIWNECNTRDVAASAAFLDAVFGIDVKPFPGTDSYKMLTVNGSVVGGVQDMAANFPAEASPHWLAWIAVDDPDESVDRAVKAGSTVLMPPTDMPGTGRLACIADPWGAPLGVMKSAKP